MFLHLKFRNCFKARQQLPCKWGENAPSLQKSFESCCVAVLCWQFRKRVAMVDFVAAVWQQLRKGRWRPRREWTPATRQLCCVNDKNVCLRIHWTASCKILQSHTRGHTTPKVLIGIRWSLGILGCSCNTNTILQDFYTQPRLASKHGLQHKVTIQRSTARIGADFGESQGMKSCQYTHTPLKQEQDIHLTGCEFSQIGRVCPRGPCWPCVPLPVKNIYFFAYTSTR